MGSTPPNHEEAVSSPHGHDSGRTEAPAPPRVNPRIAPPGYPPGDNTSVDMERNARLCELRDRVQDLRSVLGRVRNGEATLADCAGYIERARQGITELVQAIPGAEPVRRLCNAWDQIEASPLIQNPRVAPDAQVQLRQLVTLDGLCRHMVFLAGLITIPARLNDWLRLARPGYYVPFHIVFEDELPEFEDRVKVLNYLAWAPRVLQGGLVQAESGLIYRYSQDPVQRLLSLAGVLLAFLAALALIIGTCYLPIPDWPLQSTDVATMLIGWTSVLVGVLVHVGVGAVKQSQAQGGRPPIIAPEDAMLWINARFGHIMLKLLMALIGFFTLAFTASAADVTPFGMLLVGYSLDSVVEILGANLDQRVALQMAPFQRKTEAEPAPPRNR
jgi:cytochrome b561